MEKEKNLVRFVEWDWKELLDPNEVSRALQQVYDGENIPTIRDVFTDSDQHTWVISRYDLSKEEAQRIYDEIDYSDFSEETDPRDNPFYYPPTS